MKSPLTPDSFLGDLPIAVYQSRFDAGGRRVFLYMNPEMRALCGLPPEMTATARDAVTDHVPPANRGDCLRALDDARGSGGPWSFEFPFLLPDGRQAWLHDVARPSLGADGLPAWNGVLTDVTDRKERDDSLREANRVLSEHVAFFHEENRLAKHIIDHLLEYGLQSDPHIRQWTRAADTFNGDIIASTRSKKGDIYLLFADATGHGLSAAVSAVPLIPLFFRLAQIGLPIEAIARDINQTLMMALPQGRFVCAALVSLNPAKGHFRLWNAGMPQVLHIDATGHILSAIAPTNIPLGVTDWKFDIKSTVGIHTSPGDGLLFVSDGVIEATNSDNQPFGEDGVRGVIDRLGDKDLIASVRDTVLKHVGDGQASDDMAILEFRDLRDRQSAAEGQGKSALAGRRPGRIRAEW